MRILNAVIVISVVSASVYANAEPKKKVTIGEMLKQASRGANLQMRKKEFFKVPTYGDDVLSKKTRSSVDLSAVKPPKTSSFYEEATDDKAKLEKITDEQIHELYKLTQRFKNSPQRGELWLRLAEIYVEKAGIIEFRKQTEYDQNIAKFQSGKIKARPKVDLSDAREYNKRAIQLYEWFIRDFPRDPKIDQALFFLGYNNYELGNLQKGTAYYDDLTRRFPDSPFVIEANFALGEYFFEAEKWKKAFEHYSVVIAQPKHRLYSFSLYKVAWSHFRLGESAKALHAMETLIKLGKQEQASGAGRKNINKNRLETEGLRDIVLFYADIGDPLRAPEYFTALAGKDAPGYLEKLAYHYGDKGVIEGAKVIFKYLIALNPTAPKSFDYKYQTIQLYSTARQSREFREELYTWIRDFGQTGAWYAANQGNRELIENSSKLRETTLRSFVLQTHQTAQNSHAPFSQKVAREGYAIYFSEFPNSTFVGDMHFYFGELLYDMNRFSEATVQYRWVIENAPNSKFYQTSAENVVLSLEHDVPKDEEIARKVGSSLEPISFDARIEAFVQTATWYIEKFPNSKKNLELKFRTARLYYQHNQFGKAISYFGEIIKADPQSKYAEYSANLLLDIYSLKKDFAGLEKVGEELLAVGAISSSKAGRDIREILEKASFKKAQDFEVQKKYSESAVQFETFAKHNPASPLAFTAIFNAAINYERAGALQSSIAMHRKVIDSHEKGKNDFKLKSHRIIGKLYQDSGLLEEAAVAFSTAARELGKEPLVPNLYYNAAILYAALDKKNESIDSFQKCFERTAKNERADLLYQMATLHRRSDANGAAIEKYKEYLSYSGMPKEKIVESSYWIYQLSRDLGKKKDTQEWRQRTLALQAQYAPKKKGIGANFAAKIMFEEVEASFIELKDIKIPANPSKQQQAVEKKIAIMKKMNKELSDVIAYDSPDEIVGALSVLGQANYHMGESMISAPVPKELSGDQVQQYKLGVEKLAEPFFGKAKESLKATLDRSSEMEAYNRYTQKARELLASLDPKLAYPGGEMTVGVRQSSMVEQ